jgi:hypothetical protein
VTSPATRRELTRIRVRRLRARDKEGLGVYGVTIHRKRLTKTLKGWGMPEQLTWHRNLVERAVSELMAMILDDDDLVQLLGELLKARRRSS